MRLKENARKRAQAHNMASTLLSAKFYNLIIQLAGYFMLKYNKRHFPISFGTNLSHYRISRFLCLFPFPLPLSTYILFVVHGPVDFGIFWRWLYFSERTHSTNWLSRRWEEEKKKEEETKSFWVQWRKNIQCKNRVKWNAWVNVDLCICTHRIQHTINNSKTACRFEIQNMKLNTNSSRTYTQEANDVSRIPNKLPEFNFVNYYYESLAFPVYNKLSKWEDWVFFSFAFRKMSWKKCLLKATVSIENHQN